ncbi:uncharacterized protein KY384_002709 [Bacidia gigantensis]|uniref:uncharacterized protein n=1 Tax=Bacidia gigantensis TaxID=2732470 RepID=UPI001D04E29B|nr:uncharacterized protein KY384_002709 [Bacidia gigantensis]KAG8532831.1 hypothetical protein KY384_002709 [Bacidia gigantensis]
MSPPTTSAPIEQPKTSAPPASLDPKTAPAAVPATATAPSAPSGTTTAPSAGAAGGVGTGGTGASGTEGMMVEGFMMGMDMVVRDTGEDMVVMGAVVVVVEEAEVVEAPKLSFSLSRFALELIEGRVRLG